MEGDREKIPVNTGQQGGNITSESSDEQETCDKPSTSTTAPTSTPECPEKPMESNERALSGNTLVVCPGCDIKLDPHVHKFCYGCAKSTQEIISDVRKKQVDHDVRFCTDCNFELDASVHKFCYGCGQNVQEMVAAVPKEQVASLSLTAVSTFESCEQRPNSGTDVASSIKEEKEQVVVSEPALPGETFVSENEAGKGATSQADNGTERAGPAEQISKHIVVANELEVMKQVVMQEMVVTKTLTESVQQSLAAPEKEAFDDQKFVGEGNESGESNPEHAITPGSAGGELLSIDSLDLQSNIHTPNEELFPGENNSSQLPSLSELNEAVDEFDEFALQLLTTRTETVGDEQHLQELVLQQSGKLEVGSEVDEKESERKGVSSKNVEKKDVVEKECENRGATEGNNIIAVNKKDEKEKRDEKGQAENVEERKVDEKEDAKKKDQKNDDDEDEKERENGPKKEEERIDEKKDERRSVKEREHEEDEKYVDEKDDEKKEDEKSKDEKEKDEKKDFENREEKKKDDKKEDEKKQDDKKDVGKKKDEKKEDEKKQDDKKDLGKKTDEKKKDEKKEDEILQDDKKDLGKKKDEKKKDEKKEDEKKQDDKKDLGKKKDEKKKDEKKKDEKKEDEKKQDDKKDLGKKKDDKKEDEKKQDDKKDLGKKKDEKKKDEKKQDDKKDLGKKKDDKKEDEKKQDDKKDLEKKRDEKKKDDKEGGEKKEGENEDKNDENKKDENEKSEKEDEDPTTLLQLSKTATDPLSEEYTEYRKPELPKETGRKGKKGGKKQTDTKSTNQTDEKTLTVVFHAILSDKFTLEKDSTLVIRGDDPIFDGWNGLGVPVKMGQSMNKHWLLCTEINVPLRLASRSCGYKYVLLDKKGKPSYEELVEFTWSGYGIMNRCLVIENRYAVENKTFHKYDGFIYPQPTKLNRVKGLFSSGSQMAIDNRRAFFREFFPKWSGFCVNPCDVKIQLIEALERLECLFQDTTAVWTSDTTRISRCRSVEISKPKLLEFFEDILMPKIEKNLQMLESETVDVKTKVHAVVSSVVITYVFTKYNVGLDSKQCALLLKCLKLPSDKEVCLEFMGRISEFDDNILSSFTKKITTFYVQQSWKRPLIVNWLPALPLLHFLRRDCKPFEDVICESPVDVSNWKWWGLEEFSYRDIRKNISASEAIAMLPDLINVFDMDRLLKRTFLLLCPVEVYGDLLKTTECFSCLELCVTMRKLLPDTKTIKSYTPSFVEYLECFFKQVNQTLLHMRPENFPEERLKETLVLLDNLVYLVQILKSCLQLTHIQVLCRIVECLITAILLQLKETDLEATPENENKQDEKTFTSFQLRDIPEKMLTQFKKLCELVEKFLDEKLPVHLGYSRITPWKNELLVWNQLLSLSAPELFYKLWHNKFLNKFEGRIRKVNSLLQIELFCQSDEQKCVPEIATCLSEVAFEAVDIVGVHAQQNAFDNITRYQGSTNCIKLLSAMLHKAWPPDLRENTPLNEKEKDTILLHHLLTWSTWPGFLKFFGSNSRSKDELTREDDCGMMMAMAESCLYNLIDSVDDGSVTVATLKLLEEHSSQFLMLVEVNQTDQNISNSIKDSFSFRRSELKAFLTLRDHLDCFTNFTKMFRLVDDQLNVFRDKIDQDYLELPICSLCVKTSERYDVIFFKLDYKFYDMVSKITEIKRSRIFNELWKKCGERLKDKMVTMEIILSDVWLKICEELESINKKFLDGDTKLKAIDEYLSMFEMDYKALEKEFMLLSKYFNVVTHLDQIERKLGFRIEKVKSYKKLFDAHQAAQAILELQRALDLQGDFSEVESIEEIISGGFKNQSIKAVSDRLLDAGDLLEEINPERRSCLTKFIKCFELVTWLRESIKDEQELKVFVDLAMISAGEDDMEIDRISCMHTSCLGFGSLIFGYRPEHGFNDLMRLCKPVWQAFDANPSIEGKLVSTKQSLSWLKQIKESHGSVALTTMVQVEAINSSGIYYIADSENTKYIKHVNSGVKSSLESLVCLVVPEDNEKDREEKIYSLEEVKDVQSKLMLIAGKAESGKEEVDQFNQVFEGILRVSDLYVQLCEVGEINYLTWKRKFQCSKNEGRRDEMLQEINETCDTMESDLKEWKETINGKRRGCYSLNHFTMKQILNLRKELANACTGQVAVDKLPFQTFMLLETVNKTIDPLLLADVLRTMIPENSIFLTEECFKDEQKYFANEEEGGSISDESIEEEMDVIQPSRRRRANSIETLTSAKETLEAMSLDINTDEFLLAALHECGRRATKDELIFWVVSHENDDEETVKTLCEKAKKNTRLSDLVKEVFGPECQTVNDEEKIPISSGITLHEREIARPVIAQKLKQPYVNNEKDTYLALEVLAAILEKLSESESEYIHRKLPQVLKEGEPNLLLVPKGEVFGCVLSLFMGTGDQPLPTDEEVIVCDENTTAEEIELLWRRAVVDERGLLFCLVNADLLDYDVSQQAVRSLELLTQGHSKYHMVVICSIENEDKSNMVASLDQFRRPFPPVTSMRAIKNNLKRQLLVLDGTMVGDTKWEPAASVDMEKLSVRVVQSSRAGMGKSLIVKHLAEQVANLTNNKKLREDLVPSLSPTIPVHGISVDSDRVTSTLLSHAVKRDVPVSRIFHLDMSQSVVKGLDNFLFKLVILRSVKDHSGNVWRRKPTDMYVVEITTDKTFETLTAEDGSEANHSQNMRKRLATSKYSFLKFLPRTHCLTPRETLDNIQQNRRGDTGFDMEKFQSEEYQRTFQYLTQFAAGSNLDQFSFIYEPQVSIGDPDDALKIIIQYCGIRDPSWAELYHFVNFLNVQLRDCEDSVFCDPLLVGDLLQGFRTFTVRFMIQMSRDFATRSLSDNNLGVEEASTEEEDDLAPFQIRRRWELSPHPYIFFNHDRVSMTFLGFLLSQNGDLLNPGTAQILVPKMMDPTLRQQLKHQGVDFDVNYEKRDRMARIENLCSVMGIEYLYDPDSTYELTTDNVEKILAIHMRFRCGIPVIIMGETGCGKTRLIRFMCELQAGPDGPKNLLLMKVHGGTSYAEIEKKVTEAEKLALCNEAINVDTILFFDEANTTDAIDLIKEIMVDRRVNGRDINPKLTRLHFIAACNPYRKHTKEMIKKLESAGLGYHVSADETEDKLGSIPLRQLVYRVHPLPESMRPLVWDFGQLTDHTEELYTAQIVRRFMGSPTQNPAPVTLAAGLLRGILNNAPQANCIAKVLSASQKYMRGQKNECSFVSLRDVERAMKVIMWFHANSELIQQVMEDDAIEEKSDSSEESSDYDSDEDEIREIEPVEQPINDIVRAVILGIGVCYYARLNERDAYCEHICRYFDVSCPLPGGVRTMQNQIKRCQRGFLKDIQLGQNIARNTALSENVFMMAICTELRIPLFVVGKPGSSKSLAKDVISTNMKAGNSQSELFKNLKQIHVQSYQCSPLSTPEGIVSTFRQCAKLQKDKDLKKFVSVVVLDEIGLAEDSPLMPLKTLHPLLEDGTATAEESGKTSDHHRVGFIGLSNWALDPAKMNRGIMLSRGVPSEDELRDSASGICSGDEDIQRSLEETIQRLCEGYFDLYKQQSKSKTLQNAQKDEFFGLRDFYSLVKMVYGFALEAERGDRVSEIELEQSIRRNFSGLDDLDPVKIFSRKFPRLKPSVKVPSSECHPVNLIQDSLRRTEIQGESRYLLVLTENYAALRLLQQGHFQDHDPVIIFGSSFPKDQQYTQICRNINRIKVCMETGRMVVLLNLESLYESLYDALNQYYVYLDKQKYVDLGLGNHRVKCRVADKFKLIVVAEKDVVYQRFPIPLINRLEKHLLVMSTGLTETQARLVKELEKWVGDFSSAKPEHSSGQSLFKPGDCFVGYHSDTAAAVVMKISGLENQVTNAEILFQSKRTLLQTASPDAIARLAATKLKHDADGLWTEYFENQKHGSLKEYLVHCLGNNHGTDEYGSLVQVTTHSRLLSQASSRLITSAAGFKPPLSRCISLQEFHTEQQFTKTLEDFFVSLGGAEGLLLVQCDNGERNFNLIACCRYLVDDTRRRTVENFDRSVKPIHIVFIIQLPKIAGGCQHFVGFQGGKWESVHIDELLESNEQLPHIEQLVNRSVSDLFQSTNPARPDDIEDMDVDQNLDGSEEVVVENLEDDNEEGRNQEKIKPTLLLKNCLQAAAARIYDESAGVDRATKRIEILLTWLPDDDLKETEFSEVLSARIHKLLLERDERCPEDQRLWLQHEALRQGYLQETGTFRKALWQKLSSIVSPMLSEVIAYCDQNHNLNLLCEGKEWKTRLWLTMISNEKITPLSYESFVSPVSGRLRERARVLSTGAGRRFNGKFPFSWIIKDIVNVLLLQVGADPSETLASLRAVFRSSPLGKLLEPVFEDENTKNEAAMNYLNDFLHMMYKPTVEGELQLIGDAVLAAAGQIHQLLHENEEFELDIPLIHFTYSLIHARLVNFSELVHAFPQLVNEVLTLRGRLDIGEMILDVVALEWCLQQLEPKPEDLQNAENRLIWCNRIQSIRPTVQVMKTLISRTLQQQNAVGNSVERFHDQLFGDQSARILHNCRTTWIRLDVVRMFIEHTSLPGLSNHPADAQNALRLWKALGGDLDFSSVHTMTAIEKFLKNCSEEMSNRLLKFDASQCEICKGPLEDPVEMPCQHVCCMSCANGWFKDHNACPLCRKDVGANFKVEVNQRCRRALEIYNSFRNRCKSFFMELVSLYCFGEQLPNPDLVRKFISYVIKDEKRTEDFTPFDGQGIDVTPVIRSYILQQLLAIKEREKEVCDHLEEYLRRASGLAEKREDLIEVCVLCVQCMEDAERVKLLKAKEGGENVQILLVSRNLKRTMQTLHVTPSPNAVNIDCLRDIAVIRAALDALSTHLGDEFAANLASFEALPTCLEAAKHLCCNPSRSAIQLFLLKQLVRHDPNGFDAVKERCKRKELKWIMPPQAEEQDDTPDTFIVHHENYHTVREAFGKAKLTSTTNNLNGVIQDLQAQPTARSCYILLALFREVTSSFSQENGEGTIPTRVMQKLEEYVMGSQYLPNELKELARNFLTNFGNVHGRLLLQSPRQSGSDRRLTEVLVHFLIVMKCFPQNRVLQPLANLACNPALMTNAFIPTMPHDDAPEIMQANIGRWYECPNGHRYVITECGRPNQSYRCPTCNANIGGEGYVLATNNRDASRQDRSSTGHILGRALAQPEALPSERNLTSLACGVLRCLTHIAMLLGTDQNIQSIAAIIKPPVQDVVQFLREHIQHDIRCITRSTGNSDDETVQLIHLILAGIVNNLDQQRGMINIIGNLATKDSRTVWEDAFMTTCLDPVLSDMTRLLQNSFGRMVRDERLGNNRLMRLLHEQDDPSYESITELSPMCAVLWRNRKKITIEFMSFKFQEYSQARDKPDRCEVLAEFLKKEHYLRALQYFPDILKLQRLLFEKFHRRLDRIEAEKYTLGEFLRRNPQTKQQFSALVSSFKMAWKIIRSCLAKDGPYSISEEMSSLDVKSSTPISMFLPAKSGLGTCALALNNFLVTLHNDFIGRCKSLLNDESSPPEIPLSNVTMAHLVAYDPNKDFLPMIFAHCDYSLKVGEGTTIDFNWKCLERQVVDRFIRGRPGLISLIELFVFSKDICDGEVFKALKQKIPQVELTRPVQDQILNELTQLTDVCDVLKSIHIAIGFLSSAGGDPLMSIHEYLHEGLKMTLRSGLKSGKAEQFCQLQHIISLWLLLSLERARVLTQRKQDPFDDVSDRVKSSLEKKQKFDLNGGLQKLNVDHFVRVLLEFILLYLKNVPEEHLHWPLSQYVNAKLDEKGCDEIDGLEEHIPEDIQVQHAVEAWKVACQKSEDYHSRMQP